MSAAVAVVGHVEWVDFALVERVPGAGEIVEAAGTFAEPGGGGGVAAVQLRRIAGEAIFLTAVGADALGGEAVRRLEGHGVEVHAAARDAPQRRACTHLDADGERTITVTGERLVPHGDDALPWDRLAGCAGIYFTGGDVEALRAARAAGILVATPRAKDALLTAGVEVDVLVASAGDRGEPTEGIPARVVVLTEGSKGGRWAAPETSGTSARSGPQHGSVALPAPGAAGRWQAAPLPGDPVDAYGCGDTFAVALTAALAHGRGWEDALTFAARCGAACLTGRGPYGAEVPRL